MATAPTGRSNGRPKGANDTPLMNHSNQGIPTAPTGLGIAGRKDWKRIWTVGTWLHREQHYMLVRNYCQKIDEIEELKVQLEYFKKENKAKLGVALTTYMQLSGSWASYPQVKLIADGRAHILAMLGEMKLSPSHMPDDVNEATAEMAAMMKKNRG